MNRKLYHFPSSTFSRRARLCLAHKGLDVELVDARADPSKIEEARKLCPLRTMPLLLEPDGRALGDSTAIAHYLDRAYPDRPALWPKGAYQAHAALEATTLLDAALNMTVDLGTRYYALRESPAWPKVKDEIGGRIQSSLDALAKLAGSRMGKTWTEEGYGVADIWIVSAVLWIEGWPGRAPTTPLVAQLVSLGLRLPEELSRWTDTHRGRADVVALG